MSKIPDVDFIGLFNHIYNNRPLKDFRCNRDRRLRVKFKASTTDGSSYTFSFNGLDYYSHIEYHNKGQTRWLEQFTGDIGKVQKLNCQGFLMFKKLGDK